MKAAILTISCYDKIDDRIEFPLRTIQYYARRIGVDFVCKHHRENEKYSPHVEKFYLIHDMLEVYDRILYLDSDIIIKRTAPDVFKVFNCLDRLYMLNETELCKTNNDTTLAMNYIVEQKGSISSKIKYKNGRCIYYNAGFILAGRAHRDFFVISNDEYFHSTGRYEQDYLNYKIMKDDVSVEEIPVQFNTMIGYDINNEQMQGDAYFIHVTPMNKDKIVPLYRKYFLEE